MSDGVVVVGGGQAGSEAALALRSAGYEGPVSVVGAEAEMPYRRPPLSKGFLDHAETADDLVVRAGDVYAEQHIDLRLGTSVAALDRASRRLVLDGGDELAYEWLVLATGAVPRRLCCEGADAAGVHVLRGLDDARRLRADLDGARHVVVVGGGFVGLETAVSARKRGAEVTVIEVGARLMGRAVTPQVSRHTLSFHQAMGTSVCLEDSLASVNSTSGRVRSVTTARGIEYPADVVVVGVGVHAEVDLASAAGLAVDDGVVVDEYLRTSDPQVSAIGDCARFPTRFAPGRVRLESVQNATDQAAHVARRIASGVDEVFNPVPWFWSHQGNLRIQLAGLAIEHDRALVTGSTAEGRFSVLCFRDDALVGVDSVNDVRSHQSARRLLASCRVLTHAEATEPGFDIKTAAMAR